VIDRVGIGVIGVGLMGRRHAENAARRVEGARLVAVFDAARDVAGRVAADLGARAAGSVDELLAERDVSVVVVASPRRFHAEHAIAALGAGKDVLLEKPMALTLDDCDRVTEAAGRERARLQIGFMRRYDPPYVEAHRVIRSGALGQPVLYAASSRDRETVTWPAADDVAEILLESAIHDFDGARWLLGDEAARASVVASAARYGGSSGDTPGAALTTLEFARGALATVETYRGAGYAYDIRTEVVCAEGTVMIGDRPTGRLAIRRPQGEAAVKIPGWLERFGDAYLAELADFVAGARERRPPAITGADGKAAVAIALAGVSSFASREAATVSF
jgi:predicted dehydrogenase